MKLFNILLSLALVMLSFGVFAQQNAKSKAASKLYEKGGSVFIKNTNNINTENLEFSPSYYENGIVFATSRYKAGLRDEKIDETFFELFYAEFDGDGQPADPKAFSIEVNSQLHEGPVTFSRAGDLMYFTRNNQKKGIRKADAEGVTRLKVYEARKGGVDWEDVKELPFNDDAYTCMHPTLSADGRVLYFASDMPGGYGGMDIYKVDRNGDTWGTPVNLGPELNTAQHEAFPFIHSSGSIFFASNGHDGLGGLDLFMATENGSAWGSVVNLGEPFNSISDDLGLILDPEGTKGFFTSAREKGAGKDDIYMFTVDDGFNGATAPKTITSTLNVYDKQTSERIEGADIRIFEKTADGFIGNGNQLYQAMLVPSESGTGELVFKLVRQDASSFGPADLISDGNGEAIYDFVGEKSYLVMVTKEGYLNNEVVYTTIGNIGESTVSVPMDKFTCSNMKGIVKSNSGDYIPDAVVRIKSSCDGTEQIVIADGAGNFNYCLPSGCNYTLVGIKEGYNNGISTVVANGPGSPVNAEVILSRYSAPTAPGRTITTGSVIVLENIYYDFNKSAIRTGAAVELDELIAIMKQYPSMNIELSSHTDSRGTSRYNQRLSQKRAESAKQYLVTRGIVSQRIVAVGNGEANLRNRCDDGVDCSEEEHQYNRRTEVRVTRIDNPVSIQYGDNGPEVIDRKN